MSKRNTLLLVEFALWAALMSLLFPIIAYYKDMLPSRRLSVPEGVFLSGIVITGVLWFFKRLADKHSDV